MAFIKQEAMEKAREIQVKADEEFAIEKAKIVRQEAINIESAQEKKTKQAEVAQKISQSTATNKARLRVLETRESHLQELFESAREGLAGLTSDQSKYSELLKGLMLQGMLQLMEKEVTVLARSGDVQLVQGLTSDVESEYESKTKGKKVKVNVKDGLPKDSAGGVLLEGLGGRIKVNNTLDERLRLLEDRVSVVLTQALWCNRVTNFDASSLQRCSLRSGTISLARTRTASELLHEDRQLAPQLTPLASQILHMSWPKSSSRRRTLPHFSSSSATILQHVLSISPIATIAQSFRV